MAHTPQSLIQPIAQGNVPVHANNGNPFTIYNQTPNQGGYIPPTMDASGNWMINPVPQPNSFWLQPSSGPATGLPRYAAPGTGLPAPVGQPTNPFNPAPGVQPPSMSDPLPPEALLGGGGEGALSFGGGMVRPPLSPWLQFPTPTHYPGTMFGDSANLGAGMVFGGRSPSFQIGANENWLPASAQQGGTNPFGGGISRELMQTVAKIGSIAGIPGASGVQAGTGKFDWTSLVGLIPGVGGLLSMLRNAGVKAAETGHIDKLPAWAQKHLKDLADKKLANEIALVTDRTRRAIAAEEAGQGGGPVLLRRGNVWGNARNNPNFGQISNASPFGWGSMDGFRPSNFSQGSGRLGGPSGTGFGSPAGTAGITGSVGGVGGGHLSEKHLQWIANKVR